VCVPHRAGHARTGRVSRRTRKMRQAEHGVISYRQ
jgi:hypothetical protein